MRNYKTLVLTAVLGTAFLTGCASWQKGDGDRSAGRVVDDKKITSKVKDSLDNETVYKFKDVDVRTYGGVVQLSGFVATEDQKQRAGRVAENVPGVARVVNSIVIKPESGLTPTGRKSGTMDQPSHSTTNQPSQIQSGESRDTGTRSDTEAP